MGKKSREVSPIPCDHETGRNTDGSRCSIYHPLTRREIDRLLELVLVYRHQREIYKIQIRLGQAILGMVCPHLIEGPVAHKHAKFNHLYVEGLRQGGYSRGMRRDIHRLLGVK